MTGPWSRRDVLRLALGGLGALGGCSEARAPGPITSTPAEDRGADRPSGGEPAVAGGGLSVTNYSQTRVSPSVRVVDRSGSAPADRGTTPGSSADRLFFERLDLDPAEKASFPAVFPAPATPTTYRVHVDLAEGPTADSTFTHRPDSRLEFVHVGIISPTAVQITPVVA